MGGVVLLVLPLARGVAARPDVGWSNAPVAAFLFPLIGLLMAPIYPVINSVMLSLAAQAAMHAAMTGLIVVFSALGGTTGSLITGYVFASFDGHFAFYLPLVPMVLMLVTLFFFKREVERNGELPPAGSETV